jgi:hypothetical protein
MERVMAAGFVIEALEPRQLLSYSAATTEQPTVVISATANSATTSISTSASITATTTTALQSAPSFVRAGDGLDTEANGVPQGSKFPWGSDIYPPPTFHSTSPTAPGATPAGSSNSTTTAVPAAPIIIGPRLGKHGSAKHFVIRPNDIIDHSGHSSSTTTTSVGPRLGSVSPTIVLHSLPAVITEISHPELLRALTTIGVSTAESTDFSGIELADWTPSQTVAATAAIAANRLLPAIAASIGGPAAPVAPAAVGEGARMMRYLPRTGLSGLLLPLATMETEVVSTAGQSVSKWEVDVAVGSLGVVVAGYWYLSDAAARRRRQRMLAVSVFCDKPIE